MKGYTLKIKVFTTIIEAFLKCQVVFGTFAIFIYLHFLYAKLYDIGRQTVTKGPKELDNI